ncbi:testis, prostate and placenta-expressed protein-like [Gigantopelta aegis]|uniref:testis, prostate and placenta-expressed protein-like n=1 Tax=Gigantopelta aegis TaxID=1735272 RepID=UPI001B88D189|nr:testis, prostate and placenta-expressed protein-like [Gigantopelta aegis]
MTTVGAGTRPGQRLCPKKMPSYTYKYPTFRQVQIAAVKDSLFHPCLPTIRRMDMDTTNQKLPDEHCRTVTSCGPEDFKRAKTTLFEPPRRRLSVMDVTETGRKIHREYTTPDALKHSRMHWHEFLNKCPERYSIQLPERSQKDLHYTGYAVRFVSPDITSSWRKCLKSEPMLDQYGQKPLPANIFGRYRDTYPQYSRAIASETWRP